MKFDVLTLFPKMFPGALEHSITGRAIEKGLIAINAVDLRRFTHDERGTVDDKPYGGGPGMLMKVEPLFEALDALNAEEPKAKVVLTTPRGRLFDQSLAKELAGEERLILVCGHYEGVDQRFIDAKVDCEVSIGDYVLTNGNLAAMVIIDAVARLLPGVLGCDESSEDESFSGGLLEYPQYTRPELYRDLAVPEILLSGDHGKVAAWRKREAEKLTAGRRPELYAKFRAWPPKHDEKKKQN
ncbi:MAG: tRNA (guanosine(37)-N1)-methyltransferase TrmD [Victivallaceae bacterium]|nr:tRNA (guanosine(37)-N1)-methyltransferase TrmD [Victivallaceae bacterium]